MSDTIQTFEDGIKRIEEIISNLEKGDISLDKAAELYGEGVLLASKCSKQLSEAKLKITGLDEDEIKD